MTVLHKKFKHSMAMCRKCGHDLYVVKNGPSVGEVRCSNPSCEFARKKYKMGKLTNEGRIAA